MGDLNGMWVRAPVAYCGLHKCVLSVRQMRGKECLSKKCWHFRKLQHEYWDMQAEVKLARKARKQRLRS